MKTAVEDEMPDREVSNVVTGTNGWTDTLPVETIEILLRLGVIKLTSVTSGPGWSTNFYSSVERKGVDQ